MVREEAVGARAVSMQAVAVACPTESSLVDPKEEAFNEARPAEMREGRDATPCTTHRRWLVRRCAHRTL